MYLSSLPPPLCPDGHSGDLDAILRIIDDARHFVNVRDYIPATLYKHPSRLWPIIDDRELVNHSLAVRLPEVQLAAAIDRGVAIRLLVSDWLGRAKT